MAKNETNKAALTPEEKGTGEATIKEETTTGDAPQTEVASSAAPIEQQVATTKETGEDEVVEVSKADLRAFMKRMDELEESNRKLLAVADKGRMFQFSEKERAENSKIPTVKLTRIGGPTGKLVIAWRMTKNESYVDGNRLIEHQEIEVFYKDGSAEKMPLLDFYRQQNKDTVAKIKSRTREEDGSETLRVEMRDGDLVEVGLKFVN